LLLTHRGMRVGRACGAGCCRAVRPRLEAVGHRWFAGGPPPRRGPPAACPILAVVWWSMAATRRRRVGDRHGPDSPTEHGKRRRPAAAQEESGTRRGRRVRKARTGAGPPTSLQPGIPAIGGSTQRNKRGRRAPLVHGIGSRPRPVRRGDKWRSFAELDGVVLAAPKDICAGHSVGAVGEGMTFDLDYAR